MPDHAPANPADRPLANRYEANVPAATSAVQSQLNDLTAQLDALKGQLRHVHKLATLGTSAAIIAHELNNLLTPVMAYAREALDRDDIELMRTALRKTVDRTGAMRDMVERVVGLARQGETTVQAVPLRAVAAEALACLGRDLAKDNIAVDLQVDADLAVRATESQLLQVLFNLVTNARQAMLGRRGRLTIGAERPSPERVCIHVRDSGSGIDPQHLEKIFDPFFSTKHRADRPEQRGLGLGLAISKDIVEELGGQIGVVSEVGRGTVFTITLPAAN